MARLPELQREEMPTELQHYYDRIVLTRGQVAGPFPLLLHSPDVATRVANVGAFILYDSILPPAVKGLVGIITAREYDCDYEWDAFAPMAKRVGVQNEVVDAIKNRKQPTGLSKEQALVVEFCHQLLRGNHHVNEETYRAAIEHFGVRATVQIAISVGYFVMLAFMLNAFQVEYNPEVQAPAL